MPEIDDSLSVQLPPALMLECKVTGKKALYFILYWNGLAVFLHIFGFGASLSYSLGFCNCAGCFWSLFVIPFTRFPKPAAAMSMLMRVVLALVLGAVSGSFVFAILTGTAPAALLGKDVDILTHMILLNLVFGAFLVFFYTSRERVSEAKRLILEEKIRNLNGRNIAIETELKVLQAQIEPHFLFNTLSNIISLIDTDPHKAKAMIEHFCLFLRGCLHLARNRAVPISQEMEIIRNYLDIHRVRMGNRLSYKIDIPDSLLECQIPPLLIQPLVENSIKHGLEPKLEGGEVAIKGEIEGNIIRITVTDSGIGIIENATGTGIGLDNIGKRIQMLCNESGRLILEENSPSGVKAIVEVCYERG